MGSFEVRYKQLNQAQKQAVDTIEGPVLVVAGPGTGKTELLSLRVANILRQTDANPDNILCLTFTESAASTMRARLVDLIGQDAYRVNVHTFHSFGSEIISRNPEYFYNYASMQPVDDVSTYELLLNIFSKLGHSNPLSSQFNGEYTLLKSAKSAISNLKKAGLNPDDLRLIVKSNDDFIEYAEPIIQKAFDTPRMSKKQLPEIEKALKKLERYQETKKLPYDTQPLSKVLINSLSLALESGETKPVTAWKNKWLEKNRVKENIFKDRKINKKLTALAGVYEKYQEALLANNLYDFDDMILQVINQLKESPDLLADLQEQYLYVMADEFQDTNDAQLQLLKLLADSPVNEGRPNILAVGDDDQAIYRFQGAELSNILQYNEWTKNPKLVTLTDNYRSTQDILNTAKQVINQGEDRLETNIEELNKELKSNTDYTGEIKLTTYEDKLSEYSSVAKQIKQLIDSGHNASEIAVIGRKHKYLIEFLQYAHHHGIPVEYEAQDNVFDHYHVLQLIELCRLLLDIKNQNTQHVDARLPEILSYKFWGIKPFDIWQLGTKANKEKTNWLDIMQRDDKFKEISNFLFELAMSADEIGIENTFDQLIGYDEEQQFARENAKQEFKSPYYDYYFDDKTNKQAWVEFAGLLSGLSTIRNALRAYHSGKRLTLKDFVDFVDFYVSSDTPLSNNQLVLDSENSIKIMTAHKAKGMEFETVFILNCQDEVWGTKARSPIKRISFPQNLAIEPSGDSTDDKLRLFFVAVTRAKQNIFLSSHKFTETGKEQLPLSFLIGEEDQAIVNINNAKASSSKEYIDNLEIDWRSDHQLAITDNKAYLNKLIERYQLSITHLQSFLDVDNNGPLKWFVQSVLRFPKIMPAPAAYGDAIHTALYVATSEKSKNEKPAKNEDLVNIFTSKLQGFRLSESDYNFYLNKGLEELPLFLEHYYNAISTNDLPEVNFRNLGVFVGEAHLTGKMDRLALIDGKWDNSPTIEIIDYKTGKPSHSWKASSEGDRVKLHKYQQQLMFYILLIKNSEKFKNSKINDSKLVYVTLDDGKVVELNMPSDLDLQRFEKLIQAVWSKMKNLDLPDVSFYESGLRGVIAFENDLIDELEQIAQPV